MTSSSTPVSIGPRLASPPSGPAGPRAGGGVRAGRHQPGDLPPRWCSATPSRWTSTGWPTGLRSRWTGSGVRRPAPYLRRPAADRLRRQRGAAERLPGRREVARGDRPHGVAGVGFPRSRPGCPRPAGGPAPADRPADRLADGATALGCSWHHAVGDLQSFLLLMHTWSAACRELPLPAVLVADRDDELLAALPAPLHRPSPAPDAPSPPLDSPRVNAGGSGEPGRTISTSPTARSNSAASRPQRPRRLPAVDPSSTVRAPSRAPSAQLDGSEREYRLVLMGDVQRRLGLPADLIGDLMRGDLLPRLRRRRHGRAVFGRNPERHGRLSRRT